MREGGRILAHIISEVSLNVREGITLLQLDNLASRLIRKAGATPAFLGYRPEGAQKSYPATICTSLNEVVVHGVPTHYALRKGDLLKLDFGLFYRGWCVDAAVTIGILPINSEAERLIQVTRKALDYAIEVMRPGNRLGDIGYAIESCVKNGGFKVVRGLTGHGIGKRLHEDPPILNVGRKGKGELLETGMVFALEPMVSAGGDHIIQEKDESYATADRSVTAHFEHTVAVTKDGPQVLTLL